MKLSQKALEAIDNKETRRKLMEVFNCTEQTILRYINANHDNLTKAAALQIIREETGLRDNQILVEEPIKA